MPETDMETVFILPRNKLVFANSVKSFLYARTMYVCKYYLQKTVLAVLITCSIFNTSKILNYSCVECYHSGHVFLTDTVSEYIK